VEISQRAQHGVLHDIFGRLSIAQQPCRQIVSGIQMRQYELHRIAAMS